LNVPSPGYSRLSLVSMRELGEQALAWVMTHESELASTTDVLGAPTPVWFAKRNGELALVAALLADRGDARGSALLERAWDRFERGAWLAREAPQMPAIATIYPPFWRHGLRRAELETALAMPATGEPALRLLIASAHASRDRARSVTELLAESELAARPATWLVDTRYAYLAMHVAWFLAPSGLLPDELEQFLRRSLPAWISWFTRTGELDLLAEAIITAHVLGECVPGCEWQVLVDAQESDGLVPFKAAWRNQQAPARARFEANYHSTLVALGAAAVCDHATTDTRR